MSEATASRGKRIFQLALLILAGGSIYPLVYLRQNFESTILTVFNMSEVELAGIYSMLGIMFVVGYIPSGWLADRLPVKWLIVASLLITAAAGVVYVQVPDKQYLVYIYLVWGFATVFTFWSAVLKTVSVLAEENEEGRFFGALDGGRGLVEAILASVAVAIFAAFAGEGASPDETRAGFQAVVWLYVITIVVVAALLTFVLPGGVEKKVATTEGTPVESSLTAVKRIVKIPEVWLMIVVLFCGYMLYWAHYYFSGYLTVNRDISAVNAGVVTVTVLWMRPIGGFGGGFLADRFGKSRVLSIAMFATAGLLVLLALIPLGDSFTWLVYATVVLAGLLMYVIRGVYWSLLEDCRVPIAAAGIAIGVISFFGYLPDVVAPQISGLLYAAFGDDVAGANSVFFLIVAAIGLVGAVTAAYFAIRMRKRQAAEAQPVKV